MMNVILPGSSFGKFHVISFEGKDLRNISYSKRVLTLLEMTALKSYLRNSLLVLRTHLPRVEILILLFCKRIYGDAHRLQF